MIPTLYEPFRHWSDGGSVYILSDLHFDDVDCKRINLAANVCGYTPLNLGKIIKEGALSDIPGIHRITIDNATKRKQLREEMKET